MLQIPVRSIPEAVCRTDLGHRCPSRNRDAGSGTICRSSNRHAGYEPASIGVHLHHHHPYNGSTGPVYQRERLADASFISTYQPVALMPSAGGACIGSPQATAQRLGASYVIESRFGLQTSRSAATELGQGGPCVPWCTCKHLC